MSTELRLQAACSQWFWNTHIKHRKRLRRIKNELDNHPYKTKQERMIQLNENKSTGIIPGDSDFYFVDMPILYIELKTETGTQSDEQKEFEQLVKSFGHDYALVRNLQDFKTLINGRIK